MNFIRCTREIIDLEGVDQITIRRVAQVAGFNSATLYLYFKDADELITLASMSYLENYCRTLVADIPQLKTARDIYLHTWKVFCLHAFSNPKVFYRLFYYAHSKPLRETVARYYRIYSAQLEQVSGPVREMLLEGTLYERNLKVLQPLAAAGDLAESDLTLINDLTVCYFRKLLEESCVQNGILANERRTAQLLAGVNFLLSRQTGK